MIDVFAIAIDTVIIATFYACSISVCKCVQLLCKLWHTDVDCDAEWLRKWFPTFRRKRSFHSRGHLPSEAASRNDMTEIT